MKKIVLIAGVDTYQMVGAPVMHLGFQVEVEDEVAKRLLSVVCPSGPMFLKAEELDHRRVSIRLVDPTKAYRSHSIFAQGKIPISVSASIAPYLLRLSRDGSPIFEVVEE
ncbi:hypothetical protein DBW_1868 [Desulfuromonas sp. DDH964]|uniref:hypothetical protein n=1 Tax=Desulfuromonas sp. DDH964 TaxID=1823759 RepID=UPI00078EB0AD|nr:hypothetical protein [Desulfuromonas sp. DDH964]AMV72222.1 hypothetical protein DBW_1868 [Desulfuromonas sp. DDH964]